MRITWTEEAKGVTASSLDSAWDVLDRLGLALQKCDQPCEQIALALEAVREGLSADVVFWHPGMTADPFTFTGNIPLSVEWARAFLDRAGVDSTSGDRLVRHFLDPGAKPISPWPFSAALTPISRSAGSWFVALSFHPRRLFRPSELPVLRLARRLLLNQRCALENAHRRPFASDHEPKEER